MKKVTEQDSKSSGIDTFKWAIVVMMLVGGIYTNYHYAHIPVATRIIAWLALAAVTIAIALRTTHGQRFWAFSCDARQELRRVVWPTRQETMQTTIAVVIMVFVTAMMLWGIDTILLYVIGFLTGQRG